MQYRSQKIGMPSIRKITLGFMVSGVYHLNPWRMYQHETLQRKVMGYGPHTAWHSCIFMVWLNDSQDSMGTPCDARAGIVRAPHGNLQCVSYPTGLVRGPCVTRKGAIRRPYRHVKVMTQPELAKIPHGHRIWPYGSLMVPARAVHGLLMISKPVRGS